MRRITARSRFRAASALLFVPRNLYAPAPTCKMLSHQSLHVMRQYLMCLSELKETRILCTDDTLAEALGLREWSASGFSAAAEAGQEVAVTGSVTAAAAGGAAAATAAIGAAGVRVRPRCGPCDPRPLVRTWLRDEGARSDATELARDVLYVCSVSGSPASMRSTTSGVDRFGAVSNSSSSGSIRGMSSALDLEDWEMLLTHMLHQGHRRALMQTLVMLRGSPLLAQLSAGAKAAAPQAAAAAGDLSSELLRSLVRFTVEATEKAEQVSWSERRECALTNSF